MEAKIPRRAGAALVLALAGCSSSNTNPDADGSPAARGSYPVTVSTESGDVIIESAPERIVTLGNPAFENVVALGSHPVAASVTNIDKLPYLADYVGNEALDESLADIYAGQVNFERMLRSNRISSSRLLAGFHRARHVGAAPNDRSHFDIRHAGRRQRLESRRSAGRGCVG